MHAFSLGKRGEDLAVCWQLTEDLCPGDVGTVIPGGRSLGTAVFCTITGHGKANPSHILQVMTK